MDKEFSRLLFITHQTEEYSYLDSVKLALKGGCRFIQLRMKEADEDEVKQVALSAKELCRSVGAVLTIDDRVELCKELALDGVHLGKEDMSPQIARQVLGSQVWIGGTANTLEDIIELQKQGVDYIGLGPFRYTTTKKKLSPILGLKGYKDIIDCSVTHQLDLPIYAIGGIQLEDVSSLMELGLWGISLSSTILNADQPIQMTAQILEQIKNNTL